jgi:probable phosphoglycerate mutase
MQGIELDDLGCREMARCATVINPAPTVLQSSPQRRAQQSATILSSHFGLPVEIVTAMDEIDYGDWTGRPFSALVHDPAWTQWNSRRGTHRPPNGESMCALQLRVVRYLDQLRDEKTDETILIVSHAEPIRAALLYYSRTPLDDFLAIEVDSGSVSTLFLEIDEFRISAVNQRVLV